MQTTCVECGMPFEGRADAKTCSDKCRTAYRRKTGVSVTEPGRSGSKPVSVTEVPESLAPFVTDKLSVAYKSDFGKEWDIMSDGYARGCETTPVLQRIENKTAYAYFRIIKQETGFDVMGNRVTKECFDKVDWKKLNLPRFETLGKRIRDRLIDKNTDRSQK